MHLVLTKTLETQRQPIHYYSSLRNVAVDDAKEALIGTRSDEADFHGLQASTEETKTMIKKKELQRFSKHQIKSFLTEVDGLSKPSEIDIDVPKIIAFIGMY